jgi:uncharacterized membrane protein
MTDISKNAIPQSPSSINEILIDASITNSLRSLRKAFFWIFFGLILSLIPLADIAGVIILLVGIILLIIALGDMGKTKLHSANAMKSARNWILVYLLIGIVISITAVVAVIFTLSSPTTYIPGLGSQVTSVQARASTLLTGTIMAVFIPLEIAGLVVGLIAYIRLSQSLKILGTELSVRKIFNAGRYLIYSIIVTAVGSIASVVFIFGYSAFVLIRGTDYISSVVALLPLIAVPLIVLLVGVILEIIAFHSAYSGIDDFFLKQSMT